MRSFCRLSSAAKTWQYALQVSAAFIVDDAGKILIPKKYMEGHTETMMEMFDAPRRLERELRGDGKLLAAPRLVVCMDANEAGEMAATERVTLSSDRKITQVLIGKDMNEFYQLTSHQVINDWLMTQL